MKIKFIEKFMNQFSAIDTRATYGRICFQFVSAVTRIESEFSRMSKREAIEIEKTKQWKSYIDMRFSLPYNKGKSEILSHIRLLTEKMKQES